MAWIKDPNSPVGLINTDTGEKWLPQVGGGSGPQAQGSGGMTGTIGVGKGPLSDSPVSAQEYFNLIGNPNVNTGFVKNPEPLSFSDLPGMPTGQGWSDYGTTSYDQTDKGAFGLAGMPGLAIAAPFAGAAAAGAGAFGDLSNFNLFDPSSWTSLGPNFNVPGMNQLASADTGTMTDITAGTTGDLTGGVSGLPPVATGMPGADVIGSGTSGTSMSDLTGGVLTDSAGGGGSNIPLSSLIGPASSLLGGAISGSAAKTAANTQAQAGQQALDFQKQVYANQQAQLAPYQKLGGTALNTLGDYLGLTGYTTGGPQSGSLTKPFGFDISQDPGYQFRLQQGEQAITNRASATGGVSGGGDLSGATLKELLRYGQDYASGEYKNAFNRDLATKGQEFGMLTGATGIGTGATNTGVSAGGQASGTIGNTLTNIGNVQAAGQVGQANALGGALSGIANNLSQQQLLSQILKTNNPGVTSVNQGVTI